MTRRTRPVDHHGTIGRRPGRSSTTTTTYRVRTRARPDRAFAVLSDLDGYSRWLPRSLAYRGTSTAAVDRPGHVYADSTGFGRLTGAITEEQPDRRIAFEQQTARGRLHLLISYDITPAVGGAFIDRTGVITTRGIPRVLHRLVVALIRRENARTMRCLNSSPASRPTPIKRDGDGQHRARCDAGTGAESCSFS